MSSRHWQLGTWLLSGTVLAGAAVASPLDRTLNNSCILCYGVQQHPFQNASVELQAYDNYDLVAPNVNAFTSSDLQSCSMACRSTIECQAYSFDKWNKQCFLKKMPGSLRFDPSFVSGLPAGAALPSMAEGAITMEQFPGRRFFSSVHRSTHSLSLEKCEIDCRDDRGCVAFTYASSEQTCTVFESVDGYLPDQIASSGAKLQGLELPTPRTSSAENIAAKESALYERARGHADQLAAYLQTCQLCTFRDEARAELGMLMAPTVMPRTEIYRVASGVSQGIHNMRSGPGVGHSLIVSIPANSTGVSVEIDSCRSPDDGRSTQQWCKAQWRGYSGWVSMGGLVK